MNRFQKKLRQLEGQNSLRTLSQPNGIDLTSNDYLGLKNHPSLRQAALRALEGGIDIGAGGSRLLRGNTAAHEALEEFAADYFDSEKALFFSSGYQANQGIFGTLPDRHDVIIFDEYIHASAREAIQHSAAKKIKVRHNDLNGFEEALKNAEGEVVWVAVESVYSMDGDVAPLKELYALTQRHGAILVVDDAHGTGVFGKTGKGLTEDMCKTGLITLHTCGKALGVAGGIVCGAREIIDTLVNRARGFIFATAPIPLQCILVQRALELVQEEPERREKLHALIKAANDALPVDKAVSPIVPIILGNNERAVSVARTLQEKGYDVRAIRPPTVPEGTARLRVVLSCNIDEKILRDFAGELAPHLQVPDSKEKAA